MSRFYIKKNFILGSFDLKIPQHFFSKIHFLKLDATLTSCKTLEISYKLFWRKSLGKYRGYFIGTSPSGSKPMFYCFDKKTCETF